MKTHHLLAIAFAIFTTHSGAMFMQPEPVPVERLLKSAEAHLAATPDSPEAAYILARIHYLAFARSSSTVPAFAQADNDGKPAIAPNWMLDGKRADELGEAELTAHATAALTGFRGLVKTEAANGLYQLGLASLLEQIAEWKERAKPTELTDELKAVTRDQAHAAYLAAFRAGFGKDSQIKHKPISGLGSLVSYEAGKAFIRLATAESDPDPALINTLREVTDGVGKLEAIPHSGAVTPIIFSLEKADGVDRLLAPDKLVDFDLRGYGPKQRIPWIQPETALLVWDPRKRGEITSGQQLFGGYTFRIFRNNGYDALAALDDDANGVLEGKELSGIRAWFDADGDAISNPTEMRDLSDLGIAGLRVKPTGHEGPHPTCANGLLMRDGTTLPTWDWMVQPLEGNGETR